MSYAIAFAGDARLDFKAIDFWLQEEILDELEVLLANPSILPSASRDSQIVYAFNRVAGDTTHYVALTLSRNDSSRTLILLGISHRSLPSPQQP